VLIGIDMLAVQSPEGGEREPRRLARRLVSALLANDPANRYVLYAHEGLPTDRVPASRNALRVSLAGGLGKPRAAIQRVLDHNPDGLDWLVLLDPFDPAYGGMPPESPLNGPKVASLVTDLAPGRVDDRRLAPLRRHDAILATSEMAADEARRRLPSASGRVMTLGPALDDSWSSTDGPEPFAVATAEDLGRLWIVGSFLLASLAAGPGRSNLGGVLEAYHRLPLELRECHQLVITGEVADPWACLAYLHDHGCAEGLVLVGEVDDSTLRTLYARSAAFLSPCFDGGSTLALVEAMSCGAPVIAGRSAGQAEVVGDAGLLADPADPREIARQVAKVLTDADLARDLRHKARTRSGRFTWEPIVKEILDLFLEDEPTRPRPRHRFDRAHVARHRIALFATAPRDRSSTSDLSDEVARACRRAHYVDLYFEPAELALLERLPMEFSGFDARQFARNDEILDYHAVITILPDVFSIKARLKRLRARPGLVLLQDENSLERIGTGASGESQISDDIEAEVAFLRARELLLTSSRLLVRSPSTVDVIRTAFPTFADQIFGIPPLGLVDTFEESRRSDRAADVLAGLIQDCASLPRGPGRPRRDVESRSLGVPSASHSPRAVAGLDESLHGTR
jgi:glycosyltransferase involved in cell wall biosynthesis